MMMRFKTAINVNSHFVLFLFFFFALSNIRWMRKNIQGKKDCEMYIIIIIRTIITVAESLYLYIVYKYLYLYMYIYLYYINIYTYIFIDINTRYIILNWR